MITFKISIDKAGFVALFAPFLAAVLVIGALLAPLEAGEGKPAEEAQKKAKAAAQTEMPSAEEAMAAWAKLAVPGEHHAHMKANVGTWNSKGTFWMDPSQPPIPSDGKMVVSEMLGGRFFRSEYSADFMGQPFQGVAIDGYDNASQKHVSIWIDTMGTMVWVYEGTCEDNGRLTTVWADFVDPSTGQTTKTKNVTEAISDDEIKMTAYYVTPDGQEIKNMEIVYTRAK